MSEIYSLTTADFLGVKDTFEMLWDFKLFLRVARRQCIVKGSFTFGILVWKACEPCLKG